MSSSLSSRAGEVSYCTLAEVKLLRNDMSFLRSAKAGRPLVVPTVDAGVASLRGLMAASLLMLVGFLLIPKYELIF